MLRTLHVIPGCMFGPATNQIMEYRAQGNKMKQQFADFGLVTFVFISLVVCRLSKDF